MAEAVLEALPGAAQLWMTAAVNDWRPVHPSAVKIKKSEWDGILELEPSVDVLARAVVERDPGTVVVGFAVETDDPERRAEEKRIAKGCDYIVVNNPLEEGAGFAHETNAVTLLGPEGLRMRFDRMPKEALADHLLREVVERVGVGSPVR
jgi:phosphopantothenoylcysteine decarboxylase/phosphopantothenate--cysteine ligase